jgi:hypothetical protein
MMGLIPFSAASLSIALLQSQHEYQPYIANETIVSHSRLLLRANVGRVDVRGVGVHGARRKLVPRLVGETDRGQDASDLERRHQLGQGDLGGVGGGEDVVDLVKVLLLESFLGGDDKLVRAELVRVVLLVGRVREDDDVSAEGFGELDGEVCGRVSMPIA